MRTALRDPRIRLLVVVIAVALAVLVSWHLVAVGVHGMGMMLGLCVAALTAAAVVRVPGEPVLAPVSPRAPTTRAMPARDPVAPSGRHPPDEGTRLRH